MDISQEKENRSVKDAYAGTSDSESSSCSSYRSGSPVPCFHPDIQSSDQEQASRDTSEWQLSSPLFTATRQQFQFDEMSASSSDDSSSATSYVSGSPIPCFHADPSVSGTGEEFAESITKESVENMVTKAEHDKSLPFVLQKTEHSITVADKLPFWKTDILERCCFICQLLGNTTQAKSECQYCNIMLCEYCSKMHATITQTAHHVLLPLLTPQIKKRNVMCQEHGDLVEFCCQDCQKAVCSKCFTIFHRKCNTVVTLDSLIPEMKQVLQQNHDDMSSQLQKTENYLKIRRLELADITLHTSSLHKSEEPVSVDPITRKEKKLPDELDKLCEKQHDQLRSQIKSGEMYLHVGQLYLDFFEKVLQSDSPVDLYDMYTLYQATEISTELQRHDKQGNKGKRVEFVDPLESDQTDIPLQLGLSTFSESKSSLQGSPEFLFKVSTKTKDDKKASYPCDIEVFQIGGKDTLVVTDCNNFSIKSCNTSLRLDECPHALTRFSQDIVAVSHYSHNHIELVMLKPDPVHVFSIKTKKKYRCLTALNGNILAAGCKDPPSIDILDLSGRVLRSVITTSSDQQLIQVPQFMCTTRQGHIVVTDGHSGHVYSITQQGQVLFKHKLTGDNLACGGVTTTDNGSVIVADYRGDKIIELTEKGQYVRDLLTNADGIVQPQGICVYGNKLYVSENISEYVKIFQM